MKIDLEMDISPNAQVVLQLLVLKRFKRLNKFFDQFDELRLSMNELLTKELILNNPKDLSKIILKKSRESEGIESWIEEYRKLFSGTKVGSMGDKNGCLEKMQEFFVKYPEFASKDLVFKASKKYIESETGNSNYKYLQQADFFISKQETSGLVKSRLAAFCEEVLNDNSDSSSDDPFTVKA